MTPSVNWEEFSEIKHHTQAVRTVICGAKLHLERLHLDNEDVDDAIIRLGVLGKRLEAFDSYLVSLILKHEAEEAL